MNWDLFGQGILLGITAGVLPGPVMMFSLAQVIKVSAWSGFKVQLGATMMDIVRILIVFLLFSYFPFSDAFAGAIALLGAIFLLYMAYGNFTYQPKTEDSSVEIGNPIWQGIIGNISNASAYIFWFTVGGPIILKSNAAGSYDGSILFALGFLLAITAIGGLIAGLAGKVKEYLASKYYLYFIKFLGVVLIVFALLFFNQAYQLLFN